MANINNNRINVTMTAAQVTAVKAAIQTLLTNMPFLLGVSTEERMALPKISVANKQFTEDALQAVQNNPTILPAYVNVTNMQNDYTLYLQLDDIMSVLRQVYEKCEDTQMLAGSEAFTNGLTAYKLFQAAADAGMPGADSIYETLRQRFIGIGGGAQASSSPSPDNGG